MSCSLDSFNKQFPKLKDKTLVDTSGDIRLYQWITLANKQANSMGFSMPLFSTEELQGRTLVHIDPKVHDLFQEYLHSKKMDFNFDEQEYNRILETFGIHNNNVDNKDSFASIAEQYSKYERNLDMEDSSLPTNYADWKRKRESLLNTMIITIMKERKRNGDRKLINNLQKSINDLKKEIENFDVENIEHMYEAMDEEINFLHNILDNIFRPENPLEATRIFQSNFVEDRLKNLESLFAFNGNKINILFRNFPEVEVSKYYKKIEEIRKKYDNSIDNIVYNTIINNYYVDKMEKNALRNGKSTEYIKEMREAIKEIIEAGTDGDSFSANFLGASSWNNVYANVLALHKEANMMAEAGITSIWRKIIHESYAKLALLSYKNGNKKEYFIDKLFQKGTFGERTDKIINYTTNQFSEVLNILKSSKKNFLYTKNFTEEREKAYKNWMDYLKSEGYFIDLRKIKSVANKYKNESEFKDRFHASETEMDSYEKELRAKLGNTVFELELEKSINFLDRYLEDSFTNEIQKYNNNPLVFLENFYSENYDKANQSTLDYSYPGYLRVMPNIEKEEYYNQEFKEIEKQAPQDFKDFYINTRNLLQYIKETESYEGMVSDSLSINNILDRNNREVLQQLGFFGKIGHTLQNLWRSWVDTMGSTSIENENLRKDYKPSLDRTFKNHAGSFGTRESGILAKHFANLDLKNLLKEAEKLSLSIPKNNIIYNKMVQEGLAPKPEKFIPINFKYPKNNKLLTEEINKLTRAISDTHINNTRSLDIEARLNAAANIAESINTRRNTQNLMDLFKYYAKKKNLGVTLDFLQNWEASNILQVGKLQTNNKGVNTIDRTKLSSLLPGVEKVKNYSDAERYVSNILKNELKNFKKNKKSIDFNFQLSPTEKYYKKEGKYYTEKDGKITEITLKDISEVYEQYVDNLLDTMGKDVRLASIMQGIGWNLNKYYLSLNPLAGAKNLREGQAQIRQTAATGLYGFSIDQVRNARVALEWYGTFKRLQNFFGNNFATKLTNLSPRVSKSLQQISIIEHLATSLQAYNNVAEQMSGGDGYNNISRQADRFSEILSDDAIGIPEYYNQAVILVAMMQNSDFSITDKYGNKRLLYDPVTKTLPFDPHTMRLLPEFREKADGSPNMDNILNFEEFRDNSKGENPLYEMITKFREVKKASQGNYDPEDKAFISSTGLGNSTTVFKKWMFNAANNEYGKKDVDIIFGMTHVKGRMMTIAKHPSLLGAYVIANTLALPGTILKTVLEFSQDPVGTTKSVGSEFLSLKGLAMTGLLGLLIKKQRDIYKTELKNTSTGLSELQNFFKSFAERETWSIFTDAMKEISMRTLKTAINSTTRQRLDPISNDYIERISIGSKDNWNYKSMTWQERKIASAKFQSIADSINNFVQAGLISYALMFIYKALTAGPDDDNNKLEILAEYYEKMIKTILNTRNQLIQGQKQWHNVSDFIDLSTTLVAYETIGKNINKLEQAYKKWDTGEIDDLQYTSNLATYGVAPIIGVPLQLLKNIDKPGSTLLNDRLYSKKMTGDDIVLLAAKNNEEKAKIIVLEERSEIRNIVKRNVTNKINKKYPDLSKPVKEKMINKTIEDFYEDNNLSKTDFNTYQEIYNNTDWSILRNKANNEEIPINTDDLE